VPSDRAGGEGGDHDADSVHGVAPFLLWMCKNGAVRLNGPPIRLTAAGPERRPLYFCRSSGSVKLRRRLTE
jgi:hypothetical protein